MFGVTWGKFFAQVFIFLIVYLVLKKYAFGPVSAMLQERRARIEEGEANLAKIKTDLESAEAKSQELIDKANAQAEHMIEEAKASAAAIGEKKTQEAIAEANQIVEKAKEAARLEKERVTAELKRDFGRLVVDTTAKVTGKVLTSDDQERINKETAGQIAG
ncbi:MAG: F0F1 ATP synthase subunit B [Verrucomicrobiota bacterium]